MKYIFLSLIFIGKSFAGSCCGGSSSSASIILGDVKQVYRSVYSNVSVIADTNQFSMAKYRRYNEVESIKTLNLSYSSYWNDFWQWGLSLPVISKSRYLNSKWSELQGVGDLSFVIAHKTIPEYRRNFLFTKAHLYSSFKLSNSPSIYTSNRKDLLDSRGDGHEALSFGIMGFKRNRFGVTILQFEVSNRFVKTFETSALISKKITTSNSINNFISINHARDIYKNVNLSLGLSRKYIQNKTTSPLIGNDLSSQVFTFSLGIQRSFFQNYDLSLTYLDDSLIGPSYNHIISRTISVGLIARI